MRYIVNLQQRMTEQGKTNQNGCNMLPDTSGEGSIWAHQNSFPPTHKDEHSSHLTRSKFRDEQWKSLWNRTTSHGYLDRSQVPTCNISQDNKIR